MRAESLPSSCRGSYFEFTVVSRICVPSSVHTLECLPESTTCPGNEHTVLLCRTGEVYTAGYNDNGQCGQGTTQRVGVLTRVPIVAGRKAVQVKTKQFTVCLRTN